MKKHLLFLSALLLSVTALFAQAPQKMSYQAVVRNTNNTLVTNQSVSAKISILQGGVNGTPVYVETHFVTTNANGLLTLEVGNGTAVSGSMATVNWANGPYFLKSEIDPDGGINYSIEGTQQLLSVPYALYAEKAGNVPAFGIVPVDSGYVISVVQPGGTPQTYFLPTGGQGPAGPAGNDGLSAYQLWLNAGNTGSEADFLASLVGTPGNDGNDGQDGVGIDSVAKTGSVANVDTYTIYYSNHTTSTYTVTNGVDGTPGNPGDPGDPGTPGFSPTITVDTGAAGMVLTITDVNGTNQYLIPTGGGSSSGGTIVQQQVNWNETNPASVSYILNKPSLATVATSGNYNDLLNKPTIPTNISQLNNDAGYLTGQDVTNLNNNVSNLSNSVTNMSNSVNNMQSSIDTMQSNISNLQQTVANIPAPVQSNWNETNTASPAYIQNKPTIPTVPTNVSAFQNDAGYITNAAVPTFNVTQTDTGYVLTMTPPGGNAQQYVLRNGVDGENGAAGNGISYVTGPVTSGNVDTYTIHYTNGTTTNFTVTNGTNGQNGLSPTINVTTGDAGTVLTITDATGTHQHTIPNSSSSGGTIVQQQVNWNETNPSSVSYILNKPNLATVATSGNYNDLTNKPTIPTVPSNLSAFQNDAGFISSQNIQQYLPEVPAQVNADWNATSGVAQILHKPTLATVATSGSYNDLSNKPTIPAAQVNTDWNATSGIAQILNKPTLAPVATSGSYNDLSNKPTIPAAQVNADWNATSGVAQILHKPTLATVATSGNYNDLTNKPTIPTVPSNVSAFQNDAGYISSQNIQQYLPEVPAQVNADWNATSGVAQILHKPTLATVATTGSYNDLTNKPTIPTQVKSDWNVLDTSSAAYIKNKPIIPAAQVNADWNATSGVAQILHKPTLATVATSGSYNDLTNKPTIPAAQVQANWNETNTSSMAFIKNKPTIPAEQVQANWNETNTSSKAYIKNKPTIPAAQVNADWNATSGVAQILHKPALATVATSGSYNDLTNKPTIPTQVKSDWAVYDTSSLAYIKNKPTVYSYNDIQNMINSSLGALNSRIDSLQSALNAAQQAEQQNNNLTFVCGTSKVTDYDGNQYNTVKIGNQCWLKENLRTTHYSDGTSIDPVYQPSSGHDHRDGNSPAYLMGTLDGRTVCSYNMPAAFHGLPSAVIDMDDYYEQGEEEGAPLQGICPNGWHLPSYSDWYYLTSELSWGSNPMICGNNSDNIAKALADNNTSSWNTSTIECAIGNDIAANNASGFSAIGYGFSFYIPQNGGYSSGTLNPKQSTAFWSSSPYIEYGEMQNPIPTDSVYCIELNYLNPNVLSHYNNKQYLLFVRCVRDAAEGTVQQMQEQIDNLQQQLDAQGSKPYVYISSTSYSEASNSIIVNATASSSGEVLLAKGICWSTTENPTVSNNYVLSTSTSNSYTCNINNMNYGTRYYIRAFATNSNGTSYSDQRYESAGVDLGGNQYVVPANYSTTITISEAIDTGSVWVYDAGGPNGSYSNDCDGYLVIKPGNSAKKVKLMSGTYDTESCCDYIQIYDGTNTTATTGYVSQYKGSGSVTAYTSTAADGSLTIRFRSDYSVNKTGFSLRFAMVGACDGETTVTDYQNNSYSIKEYGTQCWMTQNLRSTKFSNGTSITSGGSGTSSAGIPNANTSESSPYYYRNTNFSISDYGYYYNYSAVESSNHLCPTGWHIPSVEEFGTLFSYLRGSSSNWCNTTDNTSIAKAIASKTGWSSSSYTCTVGYVPSTNNASGFNLFPAGALTTSKTFHLPSSGAYLWTQSYADPMAITTNTSTIASNSVVHGALDKACGATVRCVKD